VAMELMPSRQRAKSMVRHKHTFREATPGKRSRVMAGLVPAIQDFASLQQRRLDAWRLDAWRQARA